jgi:hypothetical protein
MTDQNRIIHTNVQASLPEDLQVWVAEQLTEDRRRKRRQEMDREDYLSVLGELYRKVNPPAASGLLSLARQGSTLEWLDTAIVVNQALAWSVERDQSGGLTSSGTLESPDLTLFD